MNITTSGIVLKQQNIAGGRRMIVLLTPDYGKISCGTSLPQNGGKGKNGLALRPFTLGRYELKRQNDLFFLNGAETLQSHYSLGENVDKFFVAAGMLERTDALLPENEPAPDVYRLLVDFLEILEKRPKRFDLIGLAYQAKLLPLSGTCPELTNCVLCGRPAGDGAAFSIESGGAVCKACAEASQSKERLHRSDRFAIIEMLRYLVNCPVSSVQGLDADPDAVIALADLLNGYYAYHLELRELNSDRERSALLQAVERKV